MKNQVTIRSSAAEYLTYIASVGEAAEQFEIRYEDPNNNRRYFYQLDGEGIRYELVSFVQAITSGVSPTYLEPAISRAICVVMEDFYQCKVQEIA